MKSEGECEGVWRRYRMNEMGREGIEVGKRFFVEQLGRVVAGVR